MNHRNIAKFYLLEVDIEFKGVFRQAKHNLIYAEKEKMQRAFYSFINNNTDLRNQYTLESLTNDLQNNYSKFLYANPTKICELPAIYQDEDKEFLAFIFSYADRELLNNDLLNFETHEKRNIDQKDVEGGLLNAHLIFRLVNSPNSTAKKLFFALESRSHITPNRVEALINHYLREKKYEIEYKDKNYTVYPQIKCSAKHSATLSEALQRGCFKEIVLLKKNKITDGQDTLPFDMAFSNFLTLTPKKYCLDAEHPISSIQKQIKLCKNDYDQLKVKIDFNKMEQTQTYDLGDYPDTNQLMEACFYHKFQLKFNDGIIKSNYNNVHPTIFKQVKTGILTDAECGVSS